MRQRGAFGLIPATVFMQGLSDAGYRETINLRVERRYASGRAERYPELLRDLSGQKPQFVFVVGHDIAKVAMTAIPDVAVVPAGIEDPVASGLIRSFNRPTGACRSSAQKPPCCPAECQAHAGSPSGW